MKPKAYSYMRSILQLTFLFLFIFSLTPDVNAQCEDFTIGDYFTHTKSKRLLKITEIKDGQLISSIQDKETYEIETKIYDCNSSITKYKLDVGDLLELKNGKTATVVDSVLREDKYFHVFMYRNTETVMMTVTSKYLDEVLKVTKKANLNEIPFKVGEMISWRSEGEIHMRGELVRNYDFDHQVKITLVDQKGFHKIVAVNKSVLLLEKNKITSADTINLLARTYTSKQYLHSERNKILNGLKMEAGAKISSSFLIELELYNEDNIMANDRYEKRMYSFKNGGFMPADRYSFSYSKMPMTPNKYESRLDYDWEYIGNRMIKLSNEVEAFILNIVSISETHLVLKIIDFRLN